MAGTRRKLPSIFQHKTGQWACKVRGRFCYLGTDLEEARKRAGQILVEGVPAGPREEPLLLSEMLASYVEHAERYYAHDSKEVGHVRRLALFIGEAFPLLAARDFGPKRLETIRDLGVTERGWSRRFANAQAARARRFFRWAVGQELLPASVLEGLRALAPLKAGRGAARDNPPREPVEKADFKATLTELGDVPRDLCLVLWATGMRPGEACGMKVGDLDMSETPWRYRLASHKTVAAVGARVVFLGPEAQAAIRPHLKPDPGAYVFRAPGDVYYSPTTLRVALHRACKRAGIKPWGPYSIRHAAADRIQRTLGAETAKLLLGHTTMKMTENYLTPDLSKAREAALQIG